VTAGGARHERSSERGEEGMATEMDCGGGGRSVGSFLGPRVAGDGRSGW
jgi:hypothetical protein